MSANIPIITVDGPSGSGKGTISQLLASHLGWHFLDSGALYRVLALAAKQHNVSLDNETAIEVLAEHLDVQFKANKTDGFSRIILEGKDVTDILRTEECGNAASKVAAFPTVRTALLARQRAFVERPGLVADGRDMGSTVFPNALLKFFLVAKVEERATRRYNQLKSKGINVSLGKVLEELRERDYRDKNRNASPLAPAHNAEIIDTTDLSIEQVLKTMLTYVDKKL